MRGFVSFDGADSLAMRNGYCQVIENSGMVVLVGYVAFAKVVMFKHSSEFGSVRISFEFTMRSD